MQAMALIIAMFEWAVLLRCAFNARKMSTVIGKRVRGLIPFKRRKGAITACTRYIIGRDEGCSLGLGKPNEIWVFFTDAKYVLSVWGERP